MDSRNEYAKFWNRINRDVSAPEPATAEDLKKKYEELSAAEIKQKARSDHPQQLMVNGDSDAIHLLCQAREIRSILVSDSGCQVVSVERLGNTVTGSDVCIRTQDVEATDKVSAAQGKVSLSPSLIHSREAYAKFGAAYAELLDELATDLEEIAVDLIEAN